ncbi:hypothetical protein BGZ60DRAFT_405993 [Tricladium varicosporioides]|nr:hypothetical protein BGZ60DRAFT_405993 [Hymenoscyphus varicosporioides]
MESTDAKRLEPTSFNFFPMLPTELRLKIYALHLSSTPPLLLPLHLCKSDLDYLRLKRPACQNYPHFFSRSLPAPPLLHVCHESREVALSWYSVGFDVGRLMSMGREETDVDTYTTCSHEVQMDDEGKALYWDRTKDVPFLTDLKTWLPENQTAYIWGGKTGVRFGRMKTVAMTAEALYGIGVGWYIGWESIDTLVILDEIKDADEARAATERNRLRGHPAERAVEAMLRNMGLRCRKRVLASGAKISNLAGSVDVKFVYGEVGDLVEWLKVSYFEGRDL